MCQALRELMKDQIDEEVRVKKEEAWAEGMAKGKAEGMAKGKAEAKLESIKALMTNLSFTAEQAMESLGIPKNEYDKYKKMI